MPWYFRYFHALIFSIFSLKISDIYRIYINDIYQWYISWYYHDIFKRKYHDIYQRKYQLVFLWFSLIPDWDINEIRTISRFPRMPWPMEASPLPHVFGRHPFHRWKPFLYEKSMLINLVMQIRLLICSVDLNVILLCLAYVVGLFLFNFIVICYPFRPEK